MPSKAHTALFFRDRNAACFVPGNINTHDSAILKLDRKIEQLLGPLVSSSDAA